MNSLVFKMLTINYPGLSLYEYEDLISIINISKNTNLAFLDNFDELVLEIDKVNVEQSYDDLLIKIENIAGLRLLERAFADGSFDD